MTWVPWLISILWLLYFSISRSQIIILFESCFHLQLGLGALLAAQVSNKIKRKTLGAHGRAATSLSLLAGVLLENRGKQRKTERTEDFAFQWDCCSQLKTCIGFFVSESKYK